MKTRQTERVKSRFSYFFRHPVTLALIPIVLGVVGWAINRYIIEQDRSALRMETQGIKQAVALVHNIQPTINGEPVFCDTANLTLLLAHNQDGRRPVSVSTVALRVEPIKPEVRLLSSDCKVDPLAQKPFGIPFRDIYLFDAAGTNLSGRFLQSAQPGYARKVNPANILQLEDNTVLSPSLKPDEVPITWDVSVTLKTTGLYRVWFSAEYDAGGFKTTQTQGFLLAK